MRLSDSDITDELVDGSLSIEPLDEETQIQPSSVDLRLGNEVKRMTGGETIAVANESPTLTTESAGDSIYIAPNEVVLATTKETVDLPNYLDGEIKGRSSVGRLFVVPHTAGYVDAGYSGEITLELINHSENYYWLPVGMRICQIVFNKLKTPAETGYNERDDSKYGGQTGPTESRLNEDFK